MGTSGEPSPARHHGPAWWLFRWAGGLLLTGLNYLFNRVPTYRRNRRELEDGEPPDENRDLPGGREHLQPLSAGVGPLFHRRYWIEVADSPYSPDELLGRVADDINAVTAWEMARFEHRDGSLAQRVEVGDELVVRIAGPWDGPVRVVDRTPNSFRFVTLEGHMEAGEIEFRCDPTEQGFLRFQIESWARSGDPLYHQVYEHVPFAREAQLHMWARFCRRVAKLSEGVVMSSVQVQTSRREMSW